MTEISERFLIYQRGPGDDIPIRVRGERAIAMTDTKSPTGGTWYCYDVRGDRLAFAGSAPYHHAVDWLFERLAPLFTNWPILMPGAIYLDDLYDTAGDGIEAIEDFGMGLVSEKVETDGEYAGMRAYRFHGTYRGRRVSLQAYLSSDLLGDAPVVALNQIKAAMVDWCTCVENYFPFYRLSSSPAEDDDVHI